MDNTQEDLSQNENSDQQVVDINNEMEIVPEPVDTPVIDKKSSNTIKSPIKANNSDNKMDVDLAPENLHDNKQQQQDISSNVIDDDDDNANDNNKRDDNDNKDDDDNEDVVTTKKTKMRYQTLIDSESDDENIKITQQNNDSSSDDENDTKTSSLKTKKIYKKFQVDSDTDEEDNTQINKENDNDVPVGFKNKSNKISDLIDSESEEDEEKRISNYPTDNEQDNSTNNKFKKSKNKKKSNVTKRAAKDEAMKMIYSESQRLLRETEISLPYHRPKQRSLKEFLNRKNIDPILPKAGTMSARLKLSASIVSKIVEEKEKEAVIFFKSDSEDEEDNCETTIQQINNEDLVNKNETSQDLSQNNTDVSKKIEDKTTDKAEENIDKIETSDNKGTGDNGVSRKLFTDDDNDDDKIIPTSQDTSVKTDEQIENKSQEKNQDEDKQVPGDNENLEKSIDPVSTDVVNLENISTNSNETTEKIKPSLKLLLDDDDDDDTSIDIKKTRDSLASQCSTDDIFASPISTQKSDVSESSNKLSTSIEQTQNTVLKNRKLSIINLPELKPKLRGTSGMMIDLTESVKPNKKAINNLMDRYLTKHANIQKQDEKKPLNVSIINTTITANGVEITNDTVSYSSNDKVDKIDDDDDLNKPGVKLVRLKEELKKKMSIKRAEEWKQKEIEMKINEEEEEDDEEENDFHEDDDEDDEKKYKKQKEIIINEDEEVVEVESEPEENDIIIKDKKRKNREYDDDEAEVSDEDIKLSDDEDEDEDDEEEGEKLELNSTDNDEESDNDADDDDVDDDNDIDETTNIKKKKFNRIVNADEDSDDDADDNLIIEKNKSTQDNKIERTKTDIELFDGENDYPVPYQIPTDTTQTNSLESPIRSTNLSSQLLVSPPTSMSLTPSNINSSPSTQTQNNNLKSLLESPKNMSAEYYRIFGTQNNDKNKLFDNKNNQVSDDDLLAICSGTFTNTTNKPDLNGLVGTQISQNVTESQLLNLCSGEFTSLTNNHTDDTSQDICLTLDDSSQPETNNNINTQNLTSKIDNNISSIDKKINSPINNTNNWNKFTVVSSDDDNDNSELTNNNKKKILKKKKVLVLSDDEDDDEEEKENDEKEVNDDDDDDEEAEEEEEEEQIVESEDEKYIDYDSDENEIIISKKDINKVAKKYVEAEAELSDSDWDSADEDEKDLDKMEIEIGDNEIIDEDQMRNQIGKIHARQQLDDDQRRVTILKEMFFDDGDLHEDGAGRERKFKWKNIDSINIDNILDKNNDDDDDNQDDIDDGINEIEWRKIRMEREKFLQENKKKIDDDADADLMRGKIIKLGMRMINKNNNNTKDEIDDNNELSNNIIHNNLIELKKNCSVKIPGILNKSKGSFLKRGEEELARLANVIKPTDSGSIQRNTKNFIFSHVSPSVVGTNNDNKDEDDNNDDIKETSSKLNKIRKRKSTSGMTPTTSKKLKIDTNKLTKKKIF